MKKVLLISNAFFISYLLVSQPYFDILRVNSAFGPITSNYSQFSVHQAELQIPIVLKSENVLLFAAHGIRNELTDKDGLPKYELSGIRLRGGINLKISDEENLLLMAINRYNGNEFSFSGDNFQLGGIIIYSKKIRDDLTYKFGAYYNGELFSSLFTPVFGFDWIINDRSRLFGNLPISANYLYSISDRLEAGVSFNGLISSFTQSQIGPFYLQRGYNHLTPHLDFYVTQNIAIQVKPGILIGSKFKLFQEQDKADWSLSALKFGDNRTIQSEIDASGFIVEFGVVYRVKT